MPLDHDSGEPIQSDDPAMAYLQTDVRARALHSLAEVSPAGLKPGDIVLLLDTDPGPADVGVDRGPRNGRIMGPVGAEVMSYYWKCA